MYLARLRARISQQGRTAVRPCFCLNYQARRRKSDYLMLPHSCFEKLSLRGRRPKSLVGAQRFFASAALRLRMTSLIFCVAYH